MKIQSYKELLAWQFSYKLSKEIYQLTKDFPHEERFGLVSQLRRASVSVPSNIAEGYHRRTRGEYLQFCHIAYGSLNEVETQLMLAKDLHMALDRSFAPVELTLQSALKLLNALCRSLEN